MRTLSSQLDAMKDFCRKVMGIVTGSRHKAYGTPASNHTCTAKMWSAYISRKLNLEVTLSARDVCFLNILQKCAREAHWSQEDNAVDIAGYAANSVACVFAETPVQPPFDIVAEDDDRDCYTRRDGVEILEY